MVKIILASGSPRRQELLGRIGVKDFEVVVPQVEETYPAGLNPEETVCYISREKSDAAARLCAADDIIITADTMVFLDDKRLGKPHGEEDALQMLRTLSGKSHAVHTGVTVLYRGKEVSRTVATEVFFRTLSDEEIRAYVKSGEPLDKAGAYGIQGIGALLVEKIVGDYDNVVGLPASALYTLFRDEFAVSLSDFIG